MTFTKILATVSTAALLATPLAAQNAPSTSPAPSTGASNPGTAASTPDNASANTQANGSTTFNTSLPRTRAEMEASLAGQTMDASSAWVGKNVVLADGEMAGTISEVYVDGGGAATARVMLADSLGINAREMLVSLNGAANANGDVQLAWTEEEFLEQAMNTVGVEPGVEKRINN